MSFSTRAFTMNLDQELDLARMQIEAPNTAVLVVGVAVPGDRGGAELVIGRSGSAGVSQEQAAAMIRALELEADRIRMLVEVGHQPRSFDA